MLQKWAVIDCLIKNVKKSIIRSAQGGNKNMEEVSYEGGGCRWPWMLTGGLWIQHGSEPGASGVSSGVMWWMEGVPVLKEADRVRLLMWEWRDYEIKEAYVIKHDVILSY